MAFTHYFCHWQILLAVSNYLSIFQSANSYSYVGKEIYRFYPFRGKLTTCEKSLSHFRDVFRVLLNIYFRKKAPSYIFDGVLNRQLHLFSANSSEYYLILISRNHKRASASILLYIYIVLTNPFWWK